MPWPAVSSSSFGLATPSPPAHDEDRKAFSRVLGLLFLQASFNAAFFPVGLVAISTLTAPSERSAFTGPVLAAGVILGFGLTPPALGAIADHWSFQIGILGLGFVTLLSSWFVRLLDDI